ncbi:CHAT domain-containing protein [Pseudanabaena sp. ABRG5-3]|uniref:CHAT domain-containing protein n=1 Tax=Pseudanabaena sp. ABRG5-3 TaxID=685565 RepID=UPI000DC70EB0|nr:tetratricopeptide repeat protein [Pseudanabaena sp. ABRG5-3]BBC26663.1 tetratricopeptide [Pseudanabaena sp. ABRG5-3]
MRYQVFGLAVIAALWVGVPLFGSVESVQAQTVQDRKAQADRLRKQGAELYQTSRYREAIPVLESALIIYREIKDREGEAISINNLGAAYKNLGQFQKAIDFFQQSLVITKQIGDRKREATSINNLGNTYSSFGQYQKAIDFFQQSLAIQQQISDREGEAVSINNLGAAYKDLGQYQKAIDFYLQSLAIRRQISDREGEATSLNNLGLAYNYLGQYQKAIDFYRQSLVITKQIGDRDGEAPSLNNLGLAYVNLGQYLMAIDFFQQSLAIQQQIEDREGEATSLNNLGGAYKSLGQFQKAIDFFQKSLAIQQQIGDRKGEAASLNNLGKVYNNLGQYQKAIVFYQQSLVITKQIGDRNGEATSLNNLGAAYDNLGQYQKGIEFSQQSLAIRRQIGDRNGEATSLNNLGDAYNNLGQYQKAIDFYQQSLAIQQQIGDQDGEARSLNNLGSAYKSLGQYQKAIDFYQQSLAIRRQIGARNGEAASLNNLGSAYINLGQYQKAIDFFQQSIAILNQFGNRYGEAGSLINLGVAYRNLGQYQKAIDFFQQSLTITKQIGNRDGEAKSFNNLGFSFKDLEQPTHAIIFYKQAINTYETIRQDIRTLSKEEQLSYRNTVIDVYRRLADLLLEKDRVMEALQVLDLLKVQDLQDFLKDVKGNDRTALGVELLPQEQKFLDEYNTIQDRAVKLGSELTELRKLQTLTPRQQQRLNEIEQIQQQVNQQLTAHLQSDSTKTLITQLQQTAAKQNTNLNAYKDLSARVQRLGQGTALFYPLILDNRIELVLFIPNQPPIHRSVNIKQTELQAEIKTFRQQLEAQSPNIETTANELYKKLIAPIEPDLKAAKIQTIVYAPDGQMRYVPLAALHDGKQWLVERYLINNVTAVSLTNLDPNPNQQSQVLAGAFEKGKYSFTVNDKSYNFTGLPFAGKEVTDLAQTIPNTVKLIDNEFSLAEVLSKMKTSNIIHLATHAAFVEGSPDNSFILLGNGDRINLREVSEWDLPNVTLVVLSACQTALGGNLGNGIEILGFGYQLQRAKVRAAIASLWTVSDGGTQQLMSAFYTAIKTGKVSHAEALRQAQVALITGNYEALGEPRGEFVSVEPRLRAKPSSAPTKLTHPYYWAPFIMIGNGL